MVVAGFKCIRKFREWKQKAGDKVQAGKAEGLDWVVAGMEEWSRWRTVQCLQDSEHVDCRGLGEGDLGT